MVFIESQKAWSIYSNMSIEVETKDINQRLAEISRKLDELLYEKEIISLMKLSEKSLSEFLEKESDIYKIDDLKVRYRRRERLP